MMLSGRGKEINHGKANLIAAMEDCPSSIKSPARSRSVAVRYGSGIKDVRFKLRDRKTLSALGAVPRGKAIVYHYWFGRQYLWRWVAVGGL
jgi:hypothetical protein